MTNDGKDFEYLVHLIERSISPDSVVEHNVHLPVIGSTSGLTRQCDVVIRSGQKPRETISIVEVQDRTSKPDITTFGGWLKKLEQVGGQHLICVSRHDFPISIKEQATKLGNTVMLITVKELTAESIPIDIEFTHRDFDLKEFNVVLTTSKSELEELGIRDDMIEGIDHGPSLKTDDKCWSLDKDELVSLQTLSLVVLDRPEEETEGEGKLIFDITKGPELYMYQGGHFFRVGLKCDFLWTYEEKKIPISVLSYEQDEAGILAWIAEFSYETRKGPASTKLPLVKTDEGFRIDGVLVNFPSGGTLTIEIQ